MVTVARWWQLLEKSTGKNQWEDSFFNLLQQPQMLWFFILIYWCTVNVNRICFEYQVFEITMIVKVFFFLPVFHLKCVIVRCDICLFWICWKVQLRGFSLKKWAFHCEKVGKASTLFSVVFGSADGVQSSNIDKKQAATRHSAPCGKLKCQTRKNLCIAYTQVNTHAHFSLPLSVFSFFFLNESLSHRRHTSPERSRAPRHEDG